MRLLLTLALFAAPLFATPVFADTAVEVRRILEALDRPAMGEARRALREIHDREGRARLLDALLDIAAGDDATAARALRLVSELGDRRAIPLLEVQLEDPAHHYAALDGLVALRARASVRKITPLLGRKGFNQRQVIYALRRLPDPIALDPLVAQLDTKSKDTLKALPGAIAAIGAPARTAIPKLIPLLKDPTPWPRKYAAQALGRLGAKEAIPHIRPLLDDDEEWVRYEAQLAMALLGAGERLPLGTDYPLTVASFAALRGLPEARRVERLRTALLGRFGDAVARELLRTRSREARDAVAHALKDMRAWNAVEAAGALLAAGDARGRPTLVRAASANDLDASRGAHAAALLGHGRADGKLVLRLLGWLDGTRGDPGARAHGAAHALATIRGTVSARRLRARAAKLPARSDLRWRLEWAAATRAAEVPALVRLAGSRFDDRRVALVVDSLRRAGKREAIPFLLDCLGDLREADVDIQGTVLRGVIHDLARDALTALAGADAPRPAATPELDAHAWRAWARR